jgi:hypothetical protein
MISSVFLVCSSVFAGAVCQTEITSWITASEPIQLNFRGSYCTMFGSVAA